MDNRVAFLETTREKLVVMRDALIEEQTRKLRDTKEEESEQGDLYDQASSDRDRELELILNEMDREKLLEIEDALERIEDGSYGVCEECDGDVAHRRLEVMPFTTVCVQCKSEKEKLSREMKRYEEERKYSKLDSIKEREDEE